jgi:sporulation protein YlmC with PRC-barrel domain
MQLTEKELLGLSVETKSGQALGVVNGFEIDVDSQKIVRYFVKPNNIIKNFLVSELVVDFQQVILITKEKMIVDDNVKKEKAYIKKAKLPAKEAIPLAT